jgi:hypothetical protein
MAGLHMLFNVKNICLDIVSLFPSFDVCFGNSDAAAFSFRESEQAMLENLSHLAIMQSITIVTAANGYSRSKSIQGRCQFGGTIKYVLATLTETFKVSQSTNNIVCEMMQPFLDLARLKVQIVSA